VGVGYLGRKMLRTGMKGSHARIDFVFGCVFFPFFSFCCVCVVVVCCCQETHFPPFMVSLAM
jgi:hypothetical protein